MPIVMEIEEGNTPMPANPHSPPWSPAPHEPRWSGYPMNDPHVYHDPKWDDKDYMASVGMGDIEFEMDMFDYFTKTDNQLALQGLREHNEHGGPFRYMDMRPLNRERYLGQFIHEGRGGPRRIDINLARIIKKNEETRALMRGKVPHEIDESGEWALRNAIFDLYGHEYGHGVKRLNEFRDLDLEHPAIYYNTYKHGTHPGMKREGKYRSETWDREYPDIPPGPWSDFQSSDYSRYDFDYLNRDMSDIAEDIIDETTMYQGRSPLDENLSRVPWQDQPDDDYDIGEFGEF